ncbi:Cytochrome P450 [Massilia sp. PDC64]|nr:cytochrome P450 [Massilia sp. PDC64]SDE79671.1 Cytochrome P450 [Massilia sp. PDC64]
MNDFDPTLPETLETPYDLYRELRARCPVAHTDEMGGFWALTRHEDVARAAADYATYTTTIQNVVPRVAASGRLPPLHLDPPDHTPYRKAITPLLAGRRVDRLRPYIERLCNELLDPLVAQGGGDMCGDYASVVPIRVFAEWMNLPLEQAEWLADVARKYARAVGMSDAEATKDNSALLYDLAVHLLNDRKTHPRDPAEDVTAALLAVRVDGAALPDEMIVGTIRQVLVVGIIAPQIVFGAMVVHLANDQALQDRLRADRDAIAPAVEEFLRLYTPYRGFARTATRDVTLHGVTIPAGEAIALVYASANRDAAVFDDAEAFRLDRPNMKDSLAFGRGPHMCPGAGLARLQLAVALEALLDRTTRFTLAGPVVPARMPEIGPVAVPVAFARRTA